MSRGERRLAAIMYTDMVGYTSLGQMKEDLALALVEEQRKLIRPILSRHNGREVKTIGDAFLVEFASALDAVRCSYDIQRAVREFNLSAEEERRLHLRIGIHLGDVVHEAGDISGDAVNVASRIESQAEDGGICLTRQVYDHVHNKFSLRLESLGERKLKNVNSPIEIFKVVMPWDDGDLTLGTRTSYDRRRIAILPFSNISQDREDEFFSDGMTDELIATMSRISDLKVIARTSVMGYKGSQKKISDIANELAVGAVVEGSVRKVGRRARITVQLIDSHTSEHLWSETYDRELEDILAIQSDISKMVARSLEVKLLDREKVEMDDRAATNVDPEAYILYLKGRYYQNERTKEGVNKAVKYFEQSAKVDPRFALAYSGLADCYVILVHYSWMTPARAGPLAKQFSTRALELDGNLAEAHASLGTTLIELSWDFTSGEAELQKSVAIRPSYAPAYHWYALMLLYLRRHEEALAMERKALQLDPYSRVINQGIALCLGGIGKYTESLEKFSELVREDPEYTSARFWKSCLDVHFGDLAKAREESTIILAQEKSPFMMLHRAWILAESADKPGAEKILSDVRQGSFDEHVRPAMMALAELALGNKEEGIRWLRRGIEDRDSMILMQRSFSWFNKYLSDSEWDRLVEERHSP